MFKKVITLVSVFSTVLLTGCATSMTSDRVITNTYESDLSGKVVRSEAVRDEWSPDSRLFSFDASPGPGLLFRKTWTDNAKRYRWANVMVHTGPAHYSGFRAPTFPKIADGVPLIKRGDIVDVLYKKEAYNDDYEGLKANALIKLVCSATDKKCIKDLEKSNKWGVSSGYEITSYSKEFLDSLTYTPVR